MDLRPITQPESDAERAAVDAVLGPGGAEPPVPAAAARGRRHLLLPALNALQARVGWVSPGGLGYAARRLAVPPAEAYGVAGFYALLSLAERPANFVHVCDDLACHAAGAEPLCAQLEQTLGPAFAPGHHRAENGGPEHASRATWARSPCLGLCEQAPAALLTSAGPTPFARGFGHATPANVRAAVEQRTVPCAPVQVFASPARLLRRIVERHDPASLDDYRARSGYVGLRRALEIGAAGVLREVGEAKLVGRGGAAFPTARKWEAVAHAGTRPHYVVANADESEPGTFKDRVLLEGDPFAVIEALTLAGFATGAAKGYLYLRGEYPLAAERLRHAIDAAAARGLLGERVLGRDFRFEVELRVGAGAYICGEETALLNSLEGRRGEPRNKPPFPALVGLFGKPTAVNNVETLVSALEIVRGGVAAWTQLGTVQSPGTKLFCLSGHVARPGTYEVPLGTRLDALIAQAGPIGEVGAVLLGGAAGTFLAGEELALPLTLEDTRRVGATLGSGAVFVLSAGTALLPYLRRLAAFFRDESCGQCVPCRVGTVRQEELLARWARGAPLGSAAAEQELLRDLGQAMRDASICGLGQTASLAIESAFKKGLR